VVSTQVATFTTALELFRNGASASHVHAALSKYQKFRAALPPPEFAMPTAPERSMLQKRASPEASAGGKVVVKPTE
jgi:hypothetical protein